jgi:hypothetical protein
MEVSVIIGKRDNVLTLTPIEDGRYKLVEPFKDIHAGFVTDGASIPRFAWRVIDHPFQSDYIEIYVEHDYDYKTGRISRVEADQKMLDGLKAKGMSYLKRYTIYWMVRIFGASHYNNKKKEA